MTTETPTTETPRATEKSASVHKAARTVICDIESSPARRSPETVSPRELKLAAREQNGVETGTATPVIVKGKGASVHDVDGTAFLDCDLAGGAVILGHADERVTAAISKAAAKGFGFGGLSESQVRLAEMLAGRFASIDMVSLTHSRARAVAGAIRLARHVTNRRKIVVWAGTLAERVSTRAAGFSLRDTALAESWALPADVREGDGNTPSDAGSESVVVVPHGDTSAVERVIGEHASQIAAVVVEPLLYSLGLASPDRELLALLRGLCDQHGALLVFDDAVGSLRAGPGGSEALTGVTPDLLCLGSEVAAALPLAVLGGRKDIMKHAAHVRGLSAFGDAPTDDLAVAASIASLQAIAEDGFYEELDAKGVRLEEGLRTAVAACGVPTEIIRVGSMLGLRFNCGASASSSSQRNDDVTQYETFFRAMLERGIMPPSSHVTPWSISAAHTNEDIDRTIEAFESALRERSNEP